MKLQIKKIFLVQRKTHLVKEYDLKTNMLNLVTGEGARGKSSIWNIIDYVCCADKCDIDFRIIQAVEWVGLVLETRSGRYVMAREIIEDVKPLSNACFLKHVAEEFDTVDGAEITANSTVSALKGVLNRVCGIEAMTDAANKKGDLITFTIRHLLNYIGQDYETIASQNHLFCYVAPVPWNTLSKYFATVIGINAETLNLLNGKKQSDETLLKKLRGEYKRALAISEDWKQNLNDQLYEAKRLTILDSNVEIPADTEKCLSLVRSIIETTKSAPVRTYNLQTLGDLADRVAKIEGKKAELEMQISEIQIRIQDLDAMERSAADIHKEALKVKDRLEIGKWLEANWSEKEPGFFNYPYSEGRLADEVRQEIAKLCKTLRRYEETALSNEKMMAFKQLNRAEIKKLKAQQEQKSTAVIALREEIEGLKTTGADEKKSINEYESVNDRAKELIGKLKSTLDFVEKLTETGDLNLKIQKLSTQVDIDIENVEKEKERVKMLQADALAEVADRAFNIAKEIELDDSFNFSHVTFDPDILDFVIEEANSVCRLRNRRSTSNHIPFHVGITAAMEEVSAGSDGALLPDFAVFDQPSQGRSGERGERCFLKVATELAKSAARTAESAVQQGWQPILIDSWGEESISKLPEDIKYNHIDLDKVGGLVPRDWMVVK